MMDDCSLANCSEIICQNYNGNNIWANHNIRIVPPCYNNVWKFQIINKHKPSYYVTYKYFKRAINTTIKCYKELTLEEVLSLTKLKQELCDAKD